MNKSPTRANMPITNLILSINSQSIHSNLIFNHSPARVPTLTHTNSSFGTSSITMPLPTNSLAHSDVKIPILDFLLLLSRILLDALPSYQVSFECTIDRHPTSICLLFVSFCGLRLVLLMMLLLQFEMNIWYIFSYLNSFVYKVC